MQCAQDEEKFFENEEFLVNLIDEHKFDIISVCEVDIVDFSPEKPFQIEGYKTFLQRSAAVNKRAL